MTDIEITLLFQRDEVVELITALNIGRFISNMNAHPTNQRDELNQAVEDWIVLDQSDKVGDLINLLEKAMNN
jgi:hypothetical protein